jgi:neurotransmitter:Na+ symporter, NSS family
LQRFLKLLGLTSRFTFKKDSFSSRFGFILAAAGSAIGLANIWKFPYISATYGGGFIVMYLLFLMLIGFPAFIAEILIGKSTEKPPMKAFQQLGKTKGWASLGQMTVWTGFLVSSFYSVVAGWIVGYFLEAITFKLDPIGTLEIASLHYEQLMNHPFWGLQHHALFMLICLVFLLGGIRRGIELCNKIFMPLFFALLLLLVGYALTLPGAGAAFHSLSSFSFTDLPKEAYIIALCHAFFKLSIGQGTIVNK